MDDYVPSVELLRDRRVFVFFKCDCCGIRHYELFEVHFPYSDVTVHLCKECLLKTIDKLYNAMEGGK